MVLGFGAFQLLIPESAGVSVDAADENGADVVEDPTNADEDVVIVETNEWTTQGRLGEADFTYAGSFAAPLDGDVEEFGFGGATIAYNPAGEGSLFISGFPKNTSVAEISIPDPAPHDGSRTDLVTSVVLQPFADITAGRGESFIGSTERGGQNDFRIGGLEVVDGPGGTRLHWTAYQEQNLVFNDVPGHGHSSLDLADPDVAGPWFLDGFRADETAGYLFDVPTDYADSFLSGDVFVSGFQQVPRTTFTSQGPSFFAFSPPAEGAAESRLTATELTNYRFDEQESSSFDEESLIPGADWASTSDGRHAIVAIGNTQPWDFSLTCTLADEVVFEDGPQIALYDPLDLAAVATGDLAPFDVEPYEIFSIEDDLIPACGTQISGAAFDAENGRLFISQLRVTANEQGFDARPVIHVFNVG